MQITLSDSRQRNRAKPHLKQAYVNYQHKIAIQKQEHKVEHKRKKDLMKQSNHYSQLSEKKEIFLFLYSSISKPFVPTNSTSEVNLV